MTPARIFLGSLVIAVALGCAVWLHGGLRAHHVTIVRGHEQGSTQQDGSILTPLHPYSTTPYTLKSKATWQDPLAIFVTVAGVGLGAAIIASGSRRPA